MKNMKTETFFVISLPRSGTKSLCKMAHILGLSYKHVPSVALPRMLNEGKTDLFADTPVYRPSFFLNALENEKSKFIYIDRGVNDWIESFERVGLHRNYNSLLSLSPKHINQINRLDRDSLYEIFNSDVYDRKLAMDSFDVHKKIIMDNIPQDRLLVYNFSDGWPNLCEFIGKHVPTEQIPHINKNTMFENIL